MTIDTIEIENFQSHAMSVVELSEGVNMIAGPSDSGKSSIMRLLRWVRDNRPMGFAFQSNFVGKDGSTSGAISFSDGSWVVRRRSNTENCYEVSTSDGPLEALRGDVPAEVSSVINIDDYCVQSQHDRYFLLQSTPGEVGRMLNEVVGIDIIDRVVKRADSLVRKANQGLQQTERDLALLGEELKDYEFVDALDKDTTQLEQLLGERDIKREERRELTRGILSADKLDNDIDYYDTFLRLELESQEFFKEVSLLNDELRLREFLDSKLSLYEDLDREVQSFEDFILPEQAVIKLASMVRTHKKWLYDEQVVVGLVERSTSVDEEIEGLNYEIEVLEEELAKIKVQIDICPFCGGPM